MRRALKAIYVYGIARCAYELAEPCPDGQNPVEHWAIIGAVSIAWPAVALFAMLDLADDARRGAI